MDRLGSGGKGQGVAVNLFSFLCKPICILKEDPYPETCAQRTLGVEDFLCLDLHTELAPEQVSQRRCLSSCSAPSSI
jgi:hypothetical protein